jgi:hypothetical protein
MDLPDGVMQIEDYAFHKCYNLTNIAIPNSVRFIGTRAFCHCTGLTEFVCNIATPPSLGSNVFDYADFTIYVPADSLEIYKTAAGWSSYADRIEAIS